MSCTLTEDMTGVRCAYFDMYVQQVSFTMMTMGGSTGGRYVHTVSGVLGVYKTHAVQ